MESEERSYSILLVSASGKFNSSLLPLLSGNSYNNVTVSSDISAARRLFAENSYDFVIVNTPLPDDFGTRFALDVCEQSATGVMLLVKAEHYPDISARVSRFGVFTLSKPTTSQMISQSLMLLSATRERLRRMEQKTASIEEKMEEIRIVNRAKWLLIEQLKMTEGEAHRYIEKQAMDRCISKRSVAESIISIYK